MNNQFDIAVIGAGPAGAMAALSASASKGLRVCLFERKPEAGSPVRCGEGIGQKGLISYINPEPDWIKTVIKRSCMISPSGIEVHIANIEESYIIDREKMDADIVKLAIKEGAIYYPNTPVTFIRKAENSIYEITTPQQIYTAKIIILADGIESKLARCFGWSTSLKLKDIETCAFARVVSPLIGRETCVFYTGSHIAPGGYAWIFPRGVGEANVGLGLSGTNSSSGRARELLDSFIYKEFPAARVYNYHCGGVPVAKWIRPLNKEGVMIVGDAARQVNALNGAGISYSLFAGKTAGKVASGAISKGVVNYLKLNEYEKIWKNIHGKQQNRSYILKEFLAKNGNDQFLDRIAKSLSKENPEKINYLRVFLKTFARNPFLLYKAFHLLR